jgi:hypothetical protein
MGFCGKEPLLRTGWVGVIPNDADALRFVIVQLWRSVGNPNPTCDVDSRKSTLRLPAIKVRFELGRRTSGGADPVGLLDKQETSR